MVPHDFRVCLRRSRIVNQYMFLPAMCLITRLCGCRTRLQHLSISTPEFGKEKQKGCDQRTLHLFLLLATLTSKCFTARNRSQGLLNGLVCLLMFFSIFER